MAGPFRLACGRPAARAHAADRAARRRATSGPGQPWRRAPRDPRAGELRDARELVARRGEKSRRGEVALQQRGVERLPARRLLGDLRRPPPGTGRARPGTPGAPRARSPARAPGSRGGPPRPRRRTAAPSSPSTSAPRSWTCRPSRGASCSEARSAASPIRTAAVASCIISARSGGQRKYSGVTPYRSAQQQLRQADRRCGWWSRARPAAPSSSSSGTWLTITQDMTGPSQPTAMSGSATRSSACRRNSTRLIGPMSRSPRDERVVELAPGCPW